MCGRNLPPIGKRNLEGLCPVTLVDAGVPSITKICIEQESAMASLMLRQNVASENSDWLRIWVRACAL